MSLMKTFDSMFGNSKDYCPDCSSEMGSNGCCSNCGYGEEDDMEEEEDEQLETQSLLDVRDTLQNALKQIDRMIVSNCDDGGGSSKPAPVMPAQIVWSRQK